MGLTKSKFDDNSCKVFLENFDYIICNNFFTNGGIICYADGLIETSYPSRIQREKINFEAKHRDYIISEITQRLDKTIKTHSENYEKEKERLSEYNFEDICDKIKKLEVDIYDVKSNNILLTELLNLKQIKSDIENFRKKYIPLVNAILINIIKIENLVPTYYYKYTQVTYDGI